MHDDAHRYLGDLAPATSNARIRFVASIAIAIGVPQFVHGTRFEQHIGPPRLHAWTASNVRVEIWPAMPAGQQYTEMHDVNR